MVLSGKERSRWLQLIVVKYVPEYVRSEYRSMSREASKLLLDALDSMINHCHLEMIQAEVMKGYSSNLGIGHARTPNRKTVTDRSCPLTNLLCCYSTTPVYQEHVDIIKERVSAWGTPSLPPNPFALMMREMQTEKEYMEMKTRKSSDKEFIEFQQSTVLAIKTCTSDFQWQSLSPIDVKDLKLFEPCKGNVLQGTLIATPSVVTGITTFLEDDEGDVIQIGLYNFVPGKMSRLNETEYVRKHLPKGTRVEIAEPFTKIFLDGNRGVRIDNPKEFRIEGAQQLDISSAREEGNAFFKQKMFYAAAESYIMGLQNESLVPTLLSNRSQAYIKLEQWPHALADAAASLTIRPTCDKTYLRYKKALAEVTDTLAPNKGDALKSVLEPTSWKNEQEECAASVGNHFFDMTTSAEGLKQAGNEAFKCQDYERAVALYTSALFASNKDVRTVLSNWSQAALEYGSYHEAVAASAASLRIIWSDGKSDKAVYRLCMSLAHLKELELAINILDSTDGSSPSLKDLKSSISRYMKALSQDDNGMTLLNSPNIKICPDFASDKDFD